MKKWSLANNSQRIISDINITPLTDVMLVLLVIFMVTTPLLMIESLKIKLPKTISADIEAGKSINISIVPDGNIYLNSKLVGNFLSASSEWKQTIFNSLKTEIITIADKAVVIKADKDIPHGIVVKVLDLAKEAGAERLSIATVPEKK